MVNLILQNRQPIIYGDGNQSRCFSDVDDCIYCIDQLLTNKNIQGEIFNIGPDEGTVSINELFEIISNKLKYNQDAIYHEDRPNEVRHAICSADKSRKILKYQTKVSLDQSLDKVINYIKSKGPKKFNYNYNVEIINEKTPKTWREKTF